MQNQKQHVFSLTKETLMVFFEAGQGKSTASKDIFSQLLAATESNANLQQNLKLANDKVQQLQEEIDSLKITIERLEDAPPVREKDA